MHFMIKKSSSRSSLLSNDREQRLNRIDPMQVCKQVETALAEASRALSHEQFASISFRLIKRLIRRAEIQGAHSQSLYLSTISTCVEKYGSNLQLLVRTILLDALCQLNSSLLQNVRIKLQKVKHTIIQTPLQYLLAKVFLLEERFLIAQGNQAGAINSLKKCIEINEAHLVEYLQQSQQIRQQIIDHVILAHYQHFRLKKIKKPTAALESLSKALSTARKSYGGENSVVRSLESVYNQQQHLVNNMDKYSSRSRAITEIVQFQSKKHYKTSAFYSWEDEKIVAQLLRTKEGERQVLNEASYEIKLDISRIKSLRNTEWLSVSNGQVVINEDQLLRLLGVNLTQPVKQMTTRIEMRNLSRDLIIKKEQLSSSEDSQDFFQRQEFKFLKHGRAQSSKKFKQTQ